MAVLPIDQIYVGGRFQRIHYSFTREATRTMQDGHIYLDGLTTLFVSDLSQPSEDLFVLSARNDPQSSGVLIADELLHVELLAPTQKFMWLYTMKNVTTFRDSYSSLCNLPAEPEVTLSDMTITEDSEDDLSTVLKYGGVNMVKHPLNVFQNKPLQKSIAISKVDTKKKYKLVLYQRDKGRVILNSKEVISSLRQGLSEDYWDINELVHNEQRAPCELLHIINSASVLVTAHGFQSNLLLYQPSHSTIAEIHTNMMYIPNFYGDLQLSLRQSFGFARYYYFKY